MNRRLAVGLLASVAGMCGGCGWLIEYENKQADEQARIERLDEENQYLGGPLEAPRVKDKDRDKDAFPEEVFVRPPLGILRTVDTTTQPLGGVVWRYLKDPKAGGKSPFTEVCLGVVKDRKDFRDEVKKLFVPSSQGWTRVTKQVPGREALTFDKATHDDPQGGNVSVYLLQKGNVQAALVYRQVSGGQGAKAIDLSLESLALGQEAARQKRAYQGRAAYRR